MAGLPQGEGNRIVGRPRKGNMRRVIDTVEKAKQILKRDVVQKKCMSIL